MRRADLKVGQRVFIRSSKYLPIQEAIVLDTQRWGYGWSTRDTRRKPIQDAGGKYVAVAAKSRLALDEWVPALVLPQHIHSYAEELLRQEQERREREERQERERQREQHRAGLQARFDQVRQEVGLPHPVSVRGNSYGGVMLVFSGDDVETLIAYLEQVSKVHNDV